MHAWHQDLHYYEGVPDDVPVVQRVPYERLSRALTQGKFARLSASVAPW